MECFTPLTSCFRCLPSTTTPNKNTPINSKKSENASIQESEFGSEVIASKQRILKILPAIYAMCPSKIARIKPNDDQKEISRRSIDVVQQLNGVYGGFRVLGFSGIFSHASIEDKGGMFRLEERDGGMDLYSRKYDVMGKATEEYITHLEGLTTQDFDNVRDHIDCFKTA